MKHLQNKNYLIKISNLSANSASPVGDVEIQSVEIESGKIYALLGRSGHGKSLLLSFLAGFPCSQWLGNIQFKEYDIFDTKLQSSDFASNRCLKNAYLRVLGKTIFMPQHFPIDKNDDVKIERDFKYLLNALVPNITKENVDDVKNAIIQKLGDDFFYKKIKDLSGGERKRFEILIRLYGAKYFCKINKGSRCVILLDEPTSGLDPCSEEEFMDFIKGVFEELKMTASIVMSTHSHHLLRKGYFDSSLKIEKFYNKGCRYCLTQINL